MLLAAVKGDARAAVGHMLNDRADAALAVLDSVADRKAAAAR